MAEQKLSANRGAKRPGRTEQSKAKILAAASELLVEKGYGGFTVEAIVARSGVAKTTIYRHWPTRTHLAGEVISRLGELAGLPDTGNVVDDLLAFITSDNPEEGSWEGKLEHMASMLDAAKDDPTLEQIVNSIRDASLDTLIEILERGRSRGEIAVDRDINVLAKILLGAAYIQHGHLNQRIDADYVGQVIDIVMNGSKPKAGGS